MRRIFSRSLAAVVITGALTGACSLPAVAADGSLVRVASHASAAAALPDVGITVGSARNQATGDVLGLGYEQVVRIEGSRVVIAEPATRGGAELRSFEAGLDTAWPMERRWFDDLDPSAPPRAVFYGGQNLLDVVKHQASRIAVLGNDIFVSRLIVNDGEYHREGGSVVSKFSADGRLQTERAFPAPVAITALDAYEHDGVPYLAIGLNMYGVRVVKADVEHLPDFRAVHEDWTGRGKDEYISVARDQVTVVDLGTDASGRLMLVAGKLTYDHPAIVASDLHAELGDDPTHVWDAEYLWENNWRPVGPAWFGKVQPVWQFPDLVAFGSLGMNREQLIAIAWPSIGRVSFLHAETGADWTWVDGSTGAHAVRFFTGADGTGYVAIARDGANSDESYVIATASEGGEWISVREGAKDDLPAAIAELTAD